MPPAPAASSKRALPSGTLPVGVGLMVLGATSYVYLFFAARGLSPSQFVEVTIVWTTLFTIGPGLFLPIEQEIARHISSTGSGQNSSSATRRLIRLGGLLTGGFVLLALAAWPLIGASLFNSDGWLFAATIAATVCLWPVHSSRGVLAGRGQFHRYGAQLSIDGTLRMIGAAVLWTMDVERASVYALVFVGSQLIAVVLTLPRPDDRELQPEPGAVRTWGSLVHALGWTLVAVLASQSLANGGTFAVKALSEPHDPAAGVFLTALVVARIPLFLYSALQASLLPGIAGMIARGDALGVRHLLRRVTLILGLLGGVATVLLTAVGPLLLRVVFGETFVISRWTLGLLSLACTVYMLAAAFGQVILAAARPRAAGIMWVLALATFLACLALPITLNDRVSVALLVGAMVTLIAAYLQIRGILRPTAQPAPHGGRTEPATTEGIES